MRTAIQFISRLLVAAAAVVLLAARVSTCESSKPPLPRNLIDAPNIEIGLQREYFGFGAVKVSIKKSGGSLHAALFRLRMAMNERCVIFDSLTMSKQFRDANWDFRYNVSRNVKYGVLESPITVITINASHALSEAAIIGNGELFQLWVHTDNSRDIEEKSERIVFAWADCDDNAFRVSSLDTAYVAAMVSAFGEGRLITDSVSSNDISCDVPRKIHIEGPCPNCLASGQLVTRIPKIIFTAGGVIGIYDGESESPGDINQNSIGYEIADAQLLQKYLANSVYELDTSSQQFDPMMEDADANEDGQTASIADLVYLYRVIVGDALPYPKLKPYQNIADVILKGDTIKIASDSAIGGVLIKFRTRETPEITNLSALKMDWSQQGAIVSVVLHPPLEDMSTNIPAGVQNLIVIKGKREFMAVDVSDYNGNMMLVRKK